MFDRRLEKMIFKKHEEKFENAIVNYINKNGNDNYNIIGFYSNGLYLGDAYDLDFYGYLKLDCVICKNDEYNFKKTYQITFKSNISYLDMIEIINVDNDFEIPFNIRLNQDFSRTMKDEDYDVIVKKILEKYYPEAFDGKTIDADIFLKRVGLNIEYKSLSESGNIFAMITFEDMIIKTYNWKNAFEYEIEDYEVKANTIVMDANVNGYYQDSYKDNFTKIHECVHALKDKKYYYFNKLFYDSSAGVFCNVNKYENNVVKKIEIQANNITSRILMYKDTIEDKIREYKNSNQLINAYDYKYLFDYLRNYFKCSIQALKIRLLSLGYSEFSGIYDYVDKKYVEPYLSNEITLLNETYSIGLVDLVFLKCDSFYKKILSSGMYLYVDSHLCINDSKFIVNIDGKNHLTSLAQNDISRCCLKFKVLYDSNFEFSNISFLRTANTIKPKYQFLINGKYQDEFNINVFKEYSESIKEEISNLPNDFGQALKKIMENRGITVEMLVSDSNISESQIKRLRNNEDQGTKLETLIKLCVGLQLPPMISKMLLKKKNFDISQNTDKNILFNFILDYMYKNKIYEIENIINDCLKSGK